jgi:hypothetical protein
LKLIEKKDEKKRFPNIDWFENYPYFGRKKVFINDLKKH